MRVACLAAVVMLVSSAAAFAQRFSPEGTDFVLRTAGGMVRYTPPGRWAVSVEGGRTVYLGIVLWHGEWVYETLAQATEVVGPTLAADGSLEVSGRFVRAEGAPPVEFQLRLVPTENGLRAQVRVRKSGELALRRGVLLLVSAPSDVFAGTEAVYLAPVACGAVGTGVTGTGDALGLELAAGRCVRLSGARYITVDFRAEGRAWNHRLRLTPDDFPVGEWTDAGWELAFEPTPDPLPGQIAPGRGPLAIRGASWDRSEVPLGRHAELTVELSATYDNPFDPDEVALDGEFTGPDGQKLSVPGFFMVDMQREVVEGQEMLRPLGAGRWCLRFSPTREGVWRCLLRLRDRSGQVSADGGELRCTPRNGHGFVRVSPRDPHYLAFDDGQGYFPIGHNLPIYHTRGQLGPQAMERFAAAGENYNRWWMSSAGLGIEWERRLGWYRQPAAWRVDYLLEQARALGMYYMMCLDTHQDFRTEGWAANPYNASRGGPCATPAEWFTNQQAKAWYRKRLRYIVARWGYSAHVLCWEFGNEIQGWEGAATDDQLAWHAEMSAYLADLDPWRHLITTSFWGGRGDERFWALPHMDIVQTHHYGGAEAGFAGIAIEHARAQWQRWEKPHLFAEFGVSARGQFHDPEGWALHNCLWAGVHSGCAGAPMPWWHENYIDPRDLYFHFTAIAHFTRDLPFGATRWQLLDGVSAQYRDPDALPPVGDILITPVSRWGKAEHSEFELLADGSVVADRRPQMLLHGRGHADLKNPPTFVVNYPQPGKFIVHINRVSAGGELVIELDGAEVLRRELPTGEGLGKSSVWREQWKLWETTYDEDIALDVPAGKHRIRVENVGRDWVEVTRYLFTGCRTYQTPDIYACGLRSDQVTILWVQNRQSTWLRHASAEPIPSVPAFRLVVPGLADGRYQVERWETWRGSRLGAEEKTVSAGRLAIDFEPLATDVAFKIRPLPGG